MIDVTADMSMSTIERDAIMCISCGCGKPNDDHGDARNITMQDVDQAAEAAGTTRYGAGRWRRPRQTLHQAHAADATARALGNVEAGKLEQQTYRVGGQRGAWRRPLAQQQATALQSQNNASVYSQSQAEQNRDAQVNAQPGTYAPSPGHDSGSDWGQDQQQINYRPPEEQEHVS